MCSKEIIKKRRYNIYETLHDSTLLYDSVNLRRITEQNRMNTDVKDMDAMRPLMKILWRDKIRNKMYKNAIVQTHRGNNNKRTGKTMSMALTCPKNERTQDTKSSKELYTPRKQKKRMIEKKNIYAKNRKGKADETTDKNGRYSSDAFGERSNFILGQMFLVTKRNI